MNFADAVVSLGCGDLSVVGQANATSATIASVANVGIAAGGTLAPDAGSIALGGKFSDAGVFVPGTSRIGIVDACGNGSSVVTGATNFYDLIVSTASGKALVLPASLTQGIKHTLVLSGAPGNLLRVTSSSAGQRAFLDVATGAAQAIAYVDARDNGATGAKIAPGTAASYRSLDSGNLFNWFADAATGMGGVVPAPLPGRMGLLLLVLLLAAVAWRPAACSCRTTDGFIVR